MGSIVSKYMEDVISKVEGHAALVEKAAAELRKLIEEVRAADVGEAEKSYNIINDLEHKADDIKRELIEELRVSFIHPDDREGLLRFIVKIDEIIGMIKASAKKLLVVSIAKLSMPSRYYDLMAEVAVHSENSVKLLRELIKYMATEPRRALGYIEGIEQEEKAVDEIRLKVYEELFVECAEEVKPHCIFVPSLIDDLEEITDKCEESVEVYRSFVITR